jgi:hypothetical protein
VVTGAELCDGADLGGSDCAAQGFDACTYTCGDDGIDPGETCDGTDLGGEDCVSQGFASGTLACAGTCDGYDTSACVPAASCGDGTIDMGEVCDGANLGTSDCTTEGFDGGTLACDASCTAFDTAGCFACGDNTVNGTEVCDGTDLDGETCVSQGFDGGALACDAACGALDTSGCFSCGDGVLNGTEVCDGTEFGAETCVTQGFDDGTLSCASTCDSIDTSACNYTCGNDVASGPEACDGADLAGETCVSQGFGGGTLACDANCGGFDTSGCTATSNVSSYRVTSLSVRDPHFFLELLGGFLGCPNCDDITNVGTSCAGNDVDSVNDQLNAQLCANTQDPAIYDLSTILHFTDLDPINDGATALLQVEENAACDYDASCATTPCGPGGAAAPTTNWVTSAMGSTACLSFDPAVVGPDNSGTPYSTINEPGPICFAQSAVIPVLNIPFNTSILPLRNARTSAEYSPQGDASPGQLVTGVIEGFLTEADAEALIVATDPAEINLANLLKGGNGACGAEDDRDTLGTDSGWWFYVNYEAEAVTYTGTVP